MNSQICTMLKRGNEEGIGIIIQSAFRTTLRYHLLLNAIGVILPGFISLKWRAGPRKRGSRKTDPNGRRRSSKSKRKTHLLSIYYHSILPPSHSSMKYNPDHLQLVLLPHLHCGASSNHRMIAGRMLHLRTVSWKRRKNITSSVL